MKKGIIIGEFSPLHLAHLDFIIDSSKIVDELYILVKKECKNEINQAIRYN